MPNEIEIEVFQQDESKPPRWVEERPLPPSEETSESRSVTDPRQMLDPDTGAFA